jgi:hypothetical protein
MTLFGVSAATALYRGFAPAAELPLPIEANGQALAFLSAPFYSVVLGQMGCSYIYKKIAPRMPDIAQKIHDNWRSFRSGVSMIGFAAHEAVQAIPAKEDFDIKELVAYGLGLTVFVHGADIKDSISSIFRSKNQHKMLD